MILNFKNKFPWGDPTNFEEKIKSGTKVTTIREDSHNRYKSGQVLHLSTGARTGKYQQFGWGVVHKTERVKIYPEYAITLCDGKNSKDLTDAEMISLAKGDGFETLIDFWRWFNEPFDGKIIHFKFFATEAEAQAYRRKEVVGFFRPDKNIFP
jgi:hypothetical protein